MQSFCYTDWKHFVIHFGNIIREVSQSLGGNGGGHSVACGAYIPHDKKDEFLNLFNQKLEGKLDV
jgi:RecJ-like exonuclease